MYPRNGDATVRPGRARRLLEVALVAAAMAAVLWFHHWTVAANNGFDDWKELDYFRSLVRGWRQGQLHMDIAPKPELLALPDPYDPTQNAAHKLGDATLYRGRYYLYFGAAPAATLMLPYTLLTGREMPMGAAVFVFVGAAFLTASGLYLAIRRRYFPASGLLMAPLGVLALGFGTHLLALAQRPMIWELPIAGGIAFTLLAIVGCYRAIHGGHPVLWMATAGLALGLAVGSRPTCLFAAPLLLAPIVHAWREGRPGRTWWRKTVAAALPLGLCGLAIMAHNYARFENPVEFGQNYQLSGAYEGKLTHFAARFLPHNLYVYFFQPLEWTWDFPFAHAEAVELAMPTDGYMGTEEVAGIAVTFPFVWFALALPLGGLGREPGERRALWITLACLGGYALPVVMLLLSYFSTCARYQADFAVAVGLLALAGMLALERWAQLRSARSAAATGPGSRWRLAPGALVRTSAFLATAVTIVIGTLMSFDYHARSLRQGEPLAWQAMDRATHAVLARTANWLGAIPGPRVLKVRFRREPIGAVQEFWESSDPRIAERIVVEHLGEQLIRFGYSRGDAPLEWGRPLRWKPKHTHTVEVQLPSLYGRHRGWMSGLMDRSDFRQRTGVAVWFSGGRALGVVMPPLGGEFQPGGRVAAEFSGEVRSIRTRVFRDDEVMTPGPADPHARRGGTLKFSLVLPHRLPSSGEPIFASGVHYESTILCVRPVAGGVVFVYHNYGHNGVESAVVPRGRGPLEVELELPVFRTQAFGEQGRGDVVLRVDGREVLRRVDVAYGFHPGNEQYGRNEFGTNCAAEFRGWMLNVRWSAGETVTTTSRE